MKLYRQQGFTLVELLISSSIGLLLLMAAGTLYLSNKSTYQTEAQLAKLQNDGEFADYFLSKEIRMAGYNGCSNDAHITITNWINNPPDTLSNTNALSGHHGNTDGSFSPMLSNAITGNPISDSDIITIHTTSSDTLFLSADMSTNTDPITLNNNVNISAGDATLITNCAVSDLFMASGGTNSVSITHSTDYNTANTLSIPYKASSEVLPYHFYAYYVRDTGRMNESNQPIYALVRENTNHQVDEITDGVEKMKVNYLVDSDGIPGPNTYQSAQEVTNSNNWGNVVAIQLSLLLSTIEEAAQTPQPYYFNGATITPADRKLRRQWDVFINLRAKGA